MHLHKWSKWSRPVSSESGDMYQFRECLKCGETSSRKLKKIGVKADEITSALQEGHPIRRE